MSLLSSIGKVVMKAAPFVSGALTGGVVGASQILGAALRGKVEKAARKSQMAKLPVLPGGGGGRMLPPLGKVAAGAAPYVLGAAGGIIWDSEPKKKKRRRKGISAKDLASFKRVARLVDKFSKPVHHFRNFKKGS